MKRVKAACICQTLHFQLKEDVGHDYAVSLVQIKTPVLSSSKLIIQVFFCQPSSNSAHCSVSTVL